MTDQPREPFPRNVDWKKRQGPFVKRGLNATERLSLGLESLVGGLLKPELNPLYHTGTITVFLLLVIIATGVYLLLFYQYGFTASYESVAGLEANFVGRLMRALHRYASVAAVFTTLLHGWRMLFQDRFRGPRWLAWVSGVVLAAFLWLVGVTGYWLIWDERAALITASFANLIDGTQWGRAFLFSMVIEPNAPTGWPFILLIVVVHVGLTLVGGLFFWLHIKRLSRAKIVPPQVFMIAIGVVLLIAAVVVPVGMLPAADGLPGPVPVDWFYLFFLPVSLSEAAPLYFLGAVALTVLIGAVPWLLPRPALEPITIHADTCTGCTLCAKDCPYDAITMHDRTDESKHQLIAKVDPAMCVSCGVCVGSCPPLAITMGTEPAEALWAHAVAAAAAEGEAVRVVFTCERHAMQGGRRFIERDAPLIIDGQRIAFVPLTCVGMAQPDLLTKALDSGAAAVQVIGCPPEDCANREGNLWLADRLDRERLPKLRRNYTDAPVTAVWAAPNAFKKALYGQAAPTEASSYKLSLPEIGIGNLIPALAVFVLVLAASIAVGRAPFAAYAADQSAIAITIQHEVGAQLANVDMTPGTSDGTARLVIILDGETVLNEAYDTASPSLRISEQVVIEAGVHEILIQLTEGDGPPLTLAEGTIFAPEGDALRYRFTDASGVGNPVAGERLFSEQSSGTNVGCKVCHSLEEGGRLVGPSLYGIADVAGERVPGLTAEEYLRQSIVDPSAYVVEGYPDGVMLPDFADRLSEQDIEDLVAYLMTLHEE